MKHSWEKDLDPRNTHEIPKNSETHQIRTRKKPHKIPREKYSDPQTHDSTIAWDPRDPQNLAHLYKIYLFKQTLFI